MPIRNEKGLAALRALSTGGSAGLDSYKQAQQAENASRTEALGTALGGTDQTANIAATQAKYAPQVNTGGLGIDNLGVAADSFLSRAADKLGAQKYENQQNLAFQAAALKQKEDEITAEERMNQLQGASEAWAAQQAGNVQADAQLGGQLGNLATRKAGARDQLTAYDEQTRALIGANPQLAAERQAGRDQILRQMAGIDEQYNAASGQYADFLGTDNKGLLENYSRADQGDTSGVKNLVDFLNPQAAAAQGMREREIEMGTQGRLRDLAPAFGIDPLTAAGQFREGEGNDLARAAARGKQDAYVAGDSAAQRAAAEDEAAPAFGFSSGKDFSAFKKSADLPDEEIEATLNSPGWGAIGQLADSFITGQADFEIPGTGRSLSLEGRTGREGLTEAIKEMVNDPTLVGPDGKPLDTAAKSKLIQLATRYYGAKAFGVEGKGEGTE